MPNAVRPSQIDDQGDDEHGVSKECGKNDGPKHRTITPQVKNMNDCCQGKTSARQGDGEQLEPNPKAPRKRVAQISRSPQAAEKAQQEGVRAEQENHSENE